jgi:hypothetical protein
VYFASLVGFANIAPTTGDPQVFDELTLAKFEADPTKINSILTANGFFTLGAQAANVTGGAANTPFCEDFDEQTVCNPTPTTPSTLPANQNGCVGNPSGIPRASTVCGDGTRQAYEECDNGTANGTTGNNCSITCRCTAEFNQATGNCN